MVAPTRPHFPFWVQPKPFQKAYNVLNLAASAPQHAPTACWAMSSRSLQVSPPLSRCSLALAGVRRAGLAVLRGTEVAHRRPKGRAKISEAGEAAAAGDLVYIVDEIREKFDRARSRNPEVTLV